MNVACRDLAIGYGRTEVGRGIAFAAEGPGVTCLLGPNGCGKTTLFKTMLGLIPPLGGEVQLAGDPIAGLARDEIARRIAYVPQAHAPPFPFRVVEIVLMGRTARIGRFAQPGAHDRDVALGALDTLGIADLAERDYSRLSGGQRQLVLIARALAQETPVLVMDEPTASLDFGNQMRVLGEVERLASAGMERTVILSTHDPDQAFALGARAVLMQAGRIAAAGAPQEVLTSQALSDVYGVAISVERSASGRFVCLPAPRTG